MVMLTACEQDQDGTGSVLILLASCQQNLYDIYHCCVYSKKTPDDGQRNCPKHVEFYSKNKFEKLVHLVGFCYKNFFKFCFLIILFCCVPNILFRRAVTSLRQVAKTPLPQYLSDIAVNDCKTLEVGVALYDNQSV